MGTNSKNSILETCGDSAIIQTPCCEFCGQWGMLEVPLATANALERGEPVQDAAPQLAPAVREQISQGTHPACWPF